MEDLLGCENMIYELMKPFVHYHDREDLFQAGAIGLKMAFDNYNESMDTKFPSYAYLWIKGEILRYVNKDKTIPISKEVLREQKRIEVTRDILRQKLLREPTVLEISLILEKEESEVLMIMEQVSRSQSQSLDERSEDEAELYNSVGMIDKGMNEDILDLRMGIDSLDETERKLIHSRYYQDLSQSEASEQLGMSQATLSRKEKQVLQKLKVKIG